MAAEEKLAPAEERRLLERLDRLETDFERRFEKIEEAFAETRERLDQPGDEQIEPSQDLQDAFAETRKRFAEARKRLDRPGGDA